MRKSQYREEQIIGILREAEGETPVKAVCAKHNISDATFYKWRMEPAIYLRLQQQVLKAANIPPTEHPIYTLYITEVTRWRYNPATRIISACIKGFRMTNTLNGKSSMEPYRAQAEIFWEPASNRNKWGYYLQQFDEFYGAAAAAYDLELNNRRLSPVPEKVILRLLEKLEVPAITEGHSLIIAERDSIPSIVMNA